jgi:archaellin
LPFTQHRLADIKTEAKYTDSALIYRFQTSYEIKQIFLNQDNFRGNKVIKEISVYVNNKQGVDLADMKNNWTFWQKVTS